MIYKHIDITININSEDINISSPRGAFYTEDRGTASIRMFIEWQNKPLNLNDNKFIPHIDLLLSDGSVFLDEKVEHINMENGVVQYNIPEKIIRHPGIVECKLFLKNDEKKLHAANFSFNINDSGIDGLISKEISIGDLRERITKVLNENIERFKGEKGNRGQKGEKGDTVLVPPKIYTRDEYEALEEKNENTLYFIREV
ncbi:BppU family phage baseplate upper protein [Staphylococcus xylosus]